MKKKVKKVEEKKNIDLEDYSKVIEKYKREINSNPNDFNKRNMLAFAYYKQGMEDEAEKELLDLIVQDNNLMAYRQLIYIEKNKGNYEDASFWAKEALNAHPDSIPLREQIVSLAKAKKDTKEQKDQESAIKAIRKQSIMNPLKYKEKNKDDLQR